MTDSTDQLPSERRTSGRELLAVALIAGQVLLVGALLSLLKLELAAVRRIVSVAALGFVVHHFLPQRHRLRFFILLSIGGLFLVMGGSPTARIVDIGLGLPRTAALLLLGGVLIWICRLPIGFWKRVGLLGVVGAGAAAFRYGAWESGNLTIIWPVLAAFFMFRVIVYLYDVSTSPKPVPFDRSVAYFFLLPNACTLLFPVIDFRTFLTKYYDEPPFVIYQRGATWMARGTIHLLLYQVVTLLFAIKITDVTTGADVIRFMVSNSLLYLKVSGSFHLCIGLLLLFGFNLPETNHRYFLASSFTDYWRRVNIYWRGFVMKVFYYPAFFKLKNLGQAGALALATLWSFFVTWALHLYQTFWLKGTASWSWPDTLFWGILGLLVLANSLWELRRGRKRKLAASRYTALEALGVAGRTAGTFALISLLWSLWSSPSLGDWARLWRAADFATVGWGLAVLGVIAVATIIFEILPTWLPAKPASAPTDFVRTSTFYRQAAMSAVSLATILGLAHWLLQPERRQPSPPSFNPARDVAAILASGADGGKGFGYYEHLASIDQTDKQLWESLRRQPFPRSFPVPDLWQPTNDFRFHEHYPNQRIDLAGVTFHTNRWGMADKDYEKAKPPGTLRVAVLGSSHVVGIGITDAERFEPVIEARLNAEHAAEGRFELLNFAIGGVGPLGHISTLRKKAGEFAPDIVVLVAHINDYGWTVDHLQRGLAGHAEADFDFHLPLLEKAHVSATTSRLVALERLTPYEAPLLDATYRQLARECQKIGALPVCVFLPLPRNLPLDRTRASELIAMAENAGFTVVDLSHIYDGMNPADLMMDEAAAYHSNARANGIIANELYNRLTTDTRIDLLARARRAAAAKP